jgi:hypothetical protein
MARGTLCVLCVSVVNLCSTCLQARPPRLTIRPPLLQLHCQVLRIRVLHWSLDVGLFGLDSRFLGLDSRVFGADSRFFGPDSRPFGLDSGSCYSTPGPSRSGSGASCSCLDAGEVISTPSPSFSCASERLPTTFTAPQLPWSLRSKCPPVRPSAFTPSLFHSLPLVSRLDALPYATPGRPRVRPHLGAHGQRDR